MKALVVQIRPDLAKHVDAASLCRRLEHFASESSNVCVSSTSSGNGNGPYITVSFSTDTLRSLWREFRGAFLLADDSEIAKMAVITCDGSHGWADYLLLHHHNREQNVDSL